MNERTGVDDLLDDLDRIPREIQSKVLIEDIEEKIMEKLRRKIAL